MKSKHFQTHSLLTDYVNSQGIARASIFAIQTDSANGGFVLWWF